MTRIHFIKMHGLGNDFIFIDNNKRDLNLTKMNIPALADRRLGIGFDQLIIIEPSNQADYACRIFNADGSEAEQCGNGLRCLGRFLKEHLKLKETHFTIETKAGSFPLEVSDYQKIHVSFHSPLIKEKYTQLIVDGTVIPVSILSLGNPHAIVKVSNLEDTRIATMAKALSIHPVFPNGVNVGFMKIENKNQIRLRTFERGAGETYACGSNACAAAAAGIINGWLSSTVQVDFSYGSLNITWQGNETAPLVMTGPASYVFSGYIDIT